MSELLDYVSFQRRVCENQLKSYDKILNESHPKYKLLKEEYEFYLLMENIVKSLENQNVTADQIDDATKVLQDVLNQFKSSLTGLNEAGFFDKTRNFFRGITKGHDINVLEKEKSIQNFTQIYQSFKPLALAANIIGRMFEKQSSQGDIINAQKLKPLKLGGSMGAELKNLISRAASSEQGLQKLKSSLSLVQNYGQGSTNPILDNFIPNDLIQNSIDVGLKSVEGGTHVGTYLKADMAKQPPPPPTKADSDMGEPKVPTPNDNSSLFKGMQHEPEHDVDLSDLNKQTKPGSASREKFRQIAKAAGLDDKTSSWMVKSGLAKWASENPDQFMKLAQQLISGGGTITENKNIIIKFVENSEKQKKLVTEVVNKWNKLAGIK